MNTRLGRMDEHPRIARDAIVSCSHFTCVAAPSISKLLRKRYQVSGRAFKERLVDVSLLLAS